MWPWLLPHAAWDRLVGDPHSANCQPTQRPPGEPHSSSPIQHGQPQPIGPTPTQPNPLRLGPPRRQGPKLFQIGHLLTKGSRIRARLCQGGRKKPHPPVLRQQWGKIIPLGGSHVSVVGLGVEQGGF